MDHYATVRRRRPSSTPNALSNRAVEPGSGIACEKLTVASPVCSAVGRFSLVLGALASVPAATAGAGGSVAVSVTFAVLPIVNEESVWLALMFVSALAMIVELPVPTALAMSVRPPSASSVS